MVVLEVEVEEEAAPAPDAVLTVKALVERVSGAAVVAALPPALYKSWLTFASAHPHRCYSSSPARVCFFARPTQAQHRRRHIPFTLIPCGCRMAQVAWGSSSYSAGLATVARCALSQYETSSITRSSGPFPLPTPRSTCCLPGAPHAPG